VNIHWHLGAEHRMADAYDRRPPEWVPWLHRGLMSVSPQKQLSRRRATLRCWMRTTFRSRSSPACGVPQTASRLYGFRVEAASKGSHVALEVLTTPSWTNPPSTSPTAKLHKSVARAPQPHPPFSLNFCCFESASSVWSELYRDECHWVFSTGGGDSTRSTAAWLIRGSG